MTREHRHALAFDAIGNFFPSPTTAMTRYMLRFSLNRKLTFLDVLQFAATLYEYGITIIF